MERVSASSGSLMPREAAGSPGKAVSDSRLLPRLIYEWLYNINSYISYGTLLWGNDPWALGLIKLQKKVVKVIAKVKPKDHCKPSF